MLHIRPIKTEADYAAALIVVEQLFDAEPETAAGDQSQTAIDAG